jgi:tRNA (cmo5U34)-methyltransferase
MRKQPSEWLTQERSRTYLDGVRGAIPAARLQLDVLARVARSWCHSPRGILDLGCGDGVIGLHLRETYPSASSVFVDFSDPMLEAARARLRSLPRAAVLRADFTSPEWVRLVAAHGPFDIVVSGFAIHHQPDERKRQLYAEIHELLSAGGVFLNLDQVESASAAVEQVFDEFFVEHLREFHRRQDREQESAHTEEA